MPGSNVLFINSYQRSGSTLLGMVLDRHQSITYLGEARNIHAYLQGNNTDFNGDRLFECEFWKHVFDALPGDPKDIFTKVRGNRCARISNCFASKVVDGLLLVTCPIFRKERKAYENIRKYYQATTIATSADWVLDSSHRTSEARSHMGHYGNHMKVLFLIRDGRGVVNSVAKRTGESVECAARNWKRFILRATKFHKTLKRDQLLFVRYEDLCADTTAQANRIANFLEVAPFNEHPFHGDHTYHFIGGSSTLRENASKGIDIELDERWRESLTPADIDKFERIAGDVNRSFGYQE